jgi:hypothetical protein
VVFILHGATALIANWAKFPAALLQDLNGLYSYLVLWRKITEKATGF